MKQHSEIITDPITKEQRLEAAIELSETTDSLEKAICHLQQLLEEFPHFAAAWVKLGQFHRRTGDRLAALEAFKLARKIVPNNWSVAVDIAAEMRELGQLEAAIRHLNRTIASYPDAYSAWFNLGLTYNKQEKREQAIASFKKALAINPEHFASSFQLAIAYKASGQTAHAEAQLKQLAASHPNKPQVYMTLGYLYQQTDNLQAAIASFDQAVQRSQQQKQKQTALLQAGISRFRIDQLEAAQSNLSEVLAQDPEHPAALRTLAAIYRRQNKIEDAIQHYQRAITTDSKNIPAQIQLSEIWRSREDYVRARHQLEKLLSVHENNLRALLHLSVLACDQRDYSSALQYCDRACSAHPDSVEPALQKAEVLRRFHHFDSAIAQLKALLNLYPSEPRILLKLGYLARQQGQRQQALTWFQQSENQLRQLAKPPVQILNTQRLVIEELRSLERIDEALTKAQALEQEHPQNTHIKLLLADLLQDHSDYSAAEKVYREAISNDPTAIAPQLSLAKLLGNTHRVPAAIELLEKQHRTGQRNFQVMMQLGALNKAEENWENTLYWYRLAKKYHPYKMDVYGALGNALYTQGNIETATALLEEAMTRFPDEPVLPIRLANLKLRFGFPSTSVQILQQARQRFPTHIPIVLQLCHLYLQLGNFEQAENLLNSIKSDQALWIKQISHIRGNIAFAKFHLDTALTHFQRSISISPATTFEHQRLALIQMLQGHIEQAHSQLVMATQAQRDRKAPGQKGQPISGHIAFLINQLRTNPPFLKALQRALTESKFDRLLSLGSLIVQEPAYLGAAAFLCKELRQQGIFAKIQDSLFCQEKNAALIPRRIVQYWDEPTPPDDVITITRSWQAHNPDYEYIRFSFETAKNFLRSHYDADIIKAFEYCDHPATQADLFRLAYLNKMGGFYADADDRCRQSLDDLINSKAELIVYQEENACIGNNFIGAVPNQGVIRSALYQAVANLLCYNNEGPWMQTGPGLLTSSLCSHLLPFLAQPDYRAWPNICVFSQEALRHYVWWAISLPYKQTLQNWQKAAYDGPK